MGDVVPMSPAMEALKAAQSAWERALDEQPPVEIRQVAVTSVQAEQIREIGNLLAQANLHDSARVLYTLHALWELS